MTGLNGIVAGKDGVKDLKSDKVGSGAQTRSPLPGVPSRVGGDKRTERESRTLGILYELEGTS
jgi:hypothetical protein